MRSIFQHQDQSPFHISVGAVLVNDEGKILVHRRSKEKLPAVLQDRDFLGGHDEVYVLMRESLENGESLEVALARGLQEEFAAEGEIIRYLGALTLDLVTPARSFEKTTLYFQVKLTAIRERAADFIDDESFTDLVWAEPAFLIEKMRAQGTVPRPDFDESKIIERYLKYGV